jgi:hypothetical protein
MPGIEPLPVGPPPGAGPYLGELAGIGLQADHLSILYMRPQDAPSAAVVAAAGVYDCIRNRGYRPLFIIHFLLAPVNTSCRQTPSPAGFLLFIVADSTEKCKQSPKNACFREKSCYYSL